MVKKLFKIELIQKDNNMYCKHCGKQIDEDSQYCKYCGSNLEIVNTHNINNEVTLKTKEESPIRIEVSKRDINRKALFKNFSLKTKTADLIVFFINSIVRFMTDVLITLLYYIPFYLTIYFVLLICNPVPLSKNWFDDYYHYINERSHGEEIIVGIGGFLIILLIKYLVRLIKWAFRNNSKRKNIQI